MSELYRAQILLESKLHEGTRFRVSLPVGDVTWLEDE